MQIIAGERKGMTLKTIEAEGFRPTLARVRESLFGILTPNIDGARVLDLFAGSGALGLEALSRGAASALFVENNKQALKVLSYNIDKTRFSDRAFVVPGDFTLAGKKVASNQQFDLVFADPPYMQGYPQRVIDHVRETRLLAAEGLCVLEMDKHEIGNLNHKGFELFRDKKYGNTIIWILKRLK